MKVETNCNIEQLSDHHRGQSIFSIIQGHQLLFDQDRSRPKRTVHEVG
jgi:hypothetical protein